MSAPLLFAGSTTFSGTVTTITMSMPIPAFGTTSGLDVMVSGAYVINNLPDASGQLFFTPLSYRVSDVSDNTVLLYAPNNSNQIFETGFVVGQADATSATMMASGASKNAFFDGFVLNGGTFTISILVSGHPPWSVTALGAVAMSGFTVSHPFATATRNRGQQVVASSSLAFTLPGSPDDPVGKFTLGQVALRGRAGAPSLVSFAGGNNPPSLWTNVVRVQDGNKEICLATYEPVAVGQGFAGTLAGISPTSDLYLDLTTYSAGATTARGYSFAAVIG